MFTLVSLATLLSAAWAQSNVELHACTERVWAADSNSFAASEYDYNLAGPELFTFVDESRFSTGLYPSYLALLIGFNPQLGVSDPNLSAEIDEFLDTFLTTEVATIAHECLVQWGRASADLAVFKEELRTWWFGKYSRSGGALDSSGFEHVFQGEIRVGGADVTGLHNWIQTYQEESAGQFVYGTSNNDCSGQGVGDLVQINNCVWRGAEKPITSLWIGKSVELEMALFTMCFRTRLNQNCNIEVNGGSPMTIVNFDISGTDYIGTAYPEC